MSVCAHACICVYVHIICVHVCVRWHVCVYVHVKCVRVSVYVRVCVCACVMCVPTVSGKQLTHETDARRLV